MNADFKINGRVIETNRLRLREFKDSDLDDFYEYASIPGVGEMAGWKHHENKEESKVILDYIIKGEETFAICDKKTNKVIGNLAIKTLELEDNSTNFNNYKGRNIGAVLSKDYWNMGLMTEALKAVIDYLFDEINLDFLTAGYFDNNIPSKKMQEKCGFKPYRKVIIDTSMGTKESGVLNILLNPKKDIKLNFPNPETLLYEQ